MAQTAFFVTAAPGYYGDASVVFSSHRTLEAALRAAPKGCAVYRGDKKKGDPWLRVYEQHHERIVADGRSGARARSPRSAAGA